MAKHLDAVPLLLKRVANRAVRPFGINPFPRAFQNPLAVGAQRPREVFEEIHRQNFWSSPESASGVGSEIKFARQYREKLENFIIENKIKRFFDAPCGDLNWMADLVLQTNIDYVGGDISERVIKFTSAKYPSISTRVFDIITDQFPESDVWHCRDCFFHLPFSAIRKALYNFSRSSIDYALITSHKSLVYHRNLDVDFGGFRFLDLELSPINLPPPMARIPDFLWGRDFPRYVCLWSREQISAALDDM